MIRRLLLALSLAAPLATQQGADSGLGFLPAQARIAASFGVLHDGLLGLAVDGQGNYFVSARRATANDPHRVFELDRSGAFVAAYAAPAATAASTWGLRDGCYDPVTDRIYWGGDRAGGAASNVYAFDVPTRSFVAQHDLNAQVASGVVRGLACDGQGRFWSCDFAAPISVFDASGARTAALPTPTDGAFGLGWDAAHGTLWIASQTGSYGGTTQGGPTAPGVHLIEVDPIAGMETGHSFRADSLLPLGFQAVAGGCEVHSVGGETVVAVLVQGLPEDGIVEVKLDASFGAGCGGVTLGHSGGNPFAGNRTFALKVTGLDPFAACAVLLGLDAAQVPVPGVATCAIMARPQLALPASVLGGAADLPIPVPIGLGRGAVSFQAIELGSTLPVDASNVVFLAILP